MIVHFQVITTRQGDRIYTLDDQGVLRVKQPQQTWREIPAIEHEQSVDNTPRRFVAPLQSSDDILAPRPSILDGYAL